jgi:hypothetical protein
LGNPKATDPKATENRKNEKKEVAYKVHNHDTETIEKERSHKKGKKIGMIFTIPIHLFT